MSNQKALQAKALSQFVAALVQLDGVGLVLEKAHVKTLKVGQHLIFEGLPYMITAMRSVPGVVEADTRYYIALDTKERILEYQDHHVLVVREKRVTRSIP